MPTLGQYTHSVSWEGNIFSKVSEPTEAGAGRIGSDWFMPSILALPRRGRPLACLYNQDFKANTTIPHSLSDIVAL